MVFCCIDRPIHTAETNRAKSSSSRSSRRHHSCMIQQAGPSAHRPAASSCMIHRVGARRGRAESARALRRLHLGNLPGRARTCVRARRLVSVEAQRRVPRRPVRRGRPAGRRRGRRAGALALTAPLHLQQPRTGRTYVGELE